jgi:hypothetical protein
MNTFALVGIELIFRKWDLFCAVVSITANKGLLKNRSGTTKLKYLI